MTGQTYQTGHIGIIIYPDRTDVKLKTYESPNGIFNRR